MSDVVGIENHNERASHMKYCRINFYLVAALALCILACSTGCSQPTAKIVGVKLQDADLTSATLLFDVKVDNPNSLALPISNLDYALTSKGQQFLTGKAPLQGSIPAKGSKILALPIKISFVELIKAVKGIRPGSTVPYTADIGLSLDMPILGTKRIPMSKEGQLDIPSGKNLLDKLEGFLQ